MKTQILKNRPGFTLLEVLVAMLILGVGIAGTVPLLLGVIRTNHLSKEMSRATRLAQTSMERIRQAGYFFAKDSPDPETIHFDGSTFTQMTEVYPTVAADGSTVERSKTYKVSISFISFGSHKVEMDTILSR
jgi:type IV pilus modification protein PilV